MNRTEIVEAMARAMQADCPDYSDLTWEETPARRKAVFIRRAQATYDDLAAQGLCVVPVDAINSLLERHISEARDRVSLCEAWSPAQAEHSRARDALLNFQDDLTAMLTAAQGGV